MHISDGLQKSLDGRGWGKDFSIFLTLQNHLHVNLSMVVISHLQHIAYVDGEK